MISLLANVLLPGVLGFKQSHEFPVVMALPLNGYQPKKSDITPMPTDEKLTKLKSGNYIRVKNGYAYVIHRDVPELAFARATSSVIAKVAKHAAISLQPAVSAVSMEASDFTTDEQAVLLKLLNDSAGVPLAEESLAGKPLAFLVAFEIRYKGSFGEVSFGPNVAGSSYKIPVEPRKPGPQNLDSVPIFTDRRSLSQAQADLAEWQRDWPLSPLPNSQYRIGTFQSSLLKVSKELIMKELGITLEQAVSDENAASKKALASLMSKLKERLGGPFEYGDVASADEQFDRQNRIALKRSLGVRGYSSVEIEEMMQSAVFQSVGLRIGLLARMKSPFNEKPQGPFMYNIYP